MSVCSDIAEYQWLTGSEAAAHLAELAAGNEPLHTSLERLRRSLSPAKAHLLLEQVELRRRAAEKFSAAERMFFTRVGLEQSTDEWIARYKAARFIPERAGAMASSPSDGRTLAIADLCCGIGGDLLALAEHGAVIGVDSDPATAYFAEANCSSVNADRAPRVAVRTTNVEDFDLGEVGAWHIDPDRRAKGRRTTSLEWCQPGLDAIERLLSRVPHAAVKLAPATKVPPHWSDCCELEWISRGGECRQLVAWHGALARTPGLRRATIIVSSPASCDPAARCVRPDAGAMPRTIAGQPDQLVPVSNDLGEFIFDVDPAIRAAHLQGALAAELNLSALAAGPSYLTGHAPIRDVAVSSFKIEDVLPLRVRDIGKYLRERGVGRLEIKKRGVDVNPEKLRRELKLCGENEATLLITPIAARPVAIVARRIA